MRSDRLPYLALSAIVLGYVILRAALVPFTHDEARCFEQFVLTGDHLPYRSAPDAGNHVLLTALAQGSYALFGHGLLALRIWSVLALVLYAWYGWQLGGRIADRTVRWCLWGALLVMPFALDFFSLFRGYGLALAFLFMAVHHVLRFAALDRLQDLALSLCAVVLATFASLSLLLMACALVAGPIFLCARQSIDRHRHARRLAIILLLGVLPLWFAAKWSFALRDAGALYYGETGGLVKAVLASLTEVTLGTRHTAVLGMVIAGFIATLVATWVRFRERAHDTMLAIGCAWLLGADLLGRVVLGEGFDVLYPTDRTALQLVPLFLLLVAASIDGFAAKRAWVKWCALALLVFPVRTVLHANLDRTAYWPEQSIPAAFFRIADERQQALDRPLMIGGYHQMPAAWRHGNRVRGIAANELDITDHPHASCDLLMIDTVLRSPPPGFRTIARAASGRNNLLERIEPLRTHIVFDTTFSLHSTGQEFLDVWKPAGVPGSELFVEVEAVIHEQDRFRAVLVLEVKDSTGTNRLYHKKELCRGRDGWNGAVLRTALRLPPVRHATDRVALYVYNPKHETFRLEPGRLRVHAVMP